MFTNVKAISIETRVVGVSFENRQKVVELLTQREQVFLVRQPENSFDPNAIKVVRWDRQQVGFLNRELAKILAPRMDKSGRFIKAAVTRLLGGNSYNSNLGVWIKFRLPE
jgi:single-stranded-DNA-specific exonuclease